MRPRWTRTTKIIIVVLALVLTAYLLYRFSIIIPPLAIAVLLAYIITPLADFVSTRLRLSRKPAVAGIYLVLVALLITAPLLFIPELLRQLGALSTELENFIASTRRLSQIVIIFGGVEVDLGVLIDSFTASAREGLQSFAAPTFNFLLNVVEFLVFGIVVIVVSFYLTKDGDKALAAFDRLVPPAYLDDARRLRGEINAVWAAYLRGQIILALVVALILTLAGFALGLRFALALGILGGLLEFIPSVGHGLWLVIALTVAFVEGSLWFPLQHWAFALIVLGTHVVFQQVDLNFLIPRIIGGHMRLHPLVVILGIVIGAAFAGVLGIALAAPTIATLRVFGRYIYAGLFDLDPFEHLAPVDAPTASHD
jgi:predicted PurR-regulated permease PerM